MRNVDIIGNKYGRLTVIEKTNERKNGQIVWLCKCDCGNIYKSVGGNLKNGNTKSCGCYAKENSSKIAKKYFKNSGKNNKGYKHGLTNTRLFRIWQNIKYRCFGKKHTYYHAYGFVGVTICKEWKNNFLSFYNWSIQNGYKDDLTIDRINNNKGYFPENCRWVTKSEQSSNRGSRVMSLKNVYSQIINIKNEPSTNKKVELLKEYLQDKTFLLVIKLMYDGLLHYHINSFPKFSKKKPKLIDQNKFSKRKLYEKLMYLAKKGSATNSEKEDLIDLCSIDEETYKILNMICNKDAKAGFSNKLINKARPGTIKIIPYCRCHTNKKIDNIQFPAVIQEKADGMFVNIMINKKGQVKIITRNGKIVWGLSRLKNLIRKTAAKKKFFQSSVYTGELLINKQGKILPRKTGNGILNSCINKTVSKADADCVVFRCWDCLPLEKFYDGYDPEIFVNRFTKVKMFVKIINNKKIVDIVLTKQVSSIEEAKEFYEYIRKNGGEGAVLKNTYGEWKNHTSPNCIKMKNVEEAELKVVSISSGKVGGKYQGILGALICESRCGKLNVSVGSGFTDKERELPFEHWLGKIITVEFEGVIKDKKKKTWSLFLPIYKELRTERSVADSLEEIMNR